MEQLINIGSIDDNVMDAEGRALWFEVKSNVRVPVTAVSVAEFLAARPSPRIVTLDLNSVTAPCRPTTSGP